MTSSDESQRSADTAAAAVPLRRKEHDENQQDGPLILPVKSLDTGVINVSIVEVCQCENAILLIQILLDLLADALCRRTPLGEAD